MPGLARIGDLAIGIDAHPVPPFVFPWIGTPVTGSPTTTIQGIPSARIGDMYATTCPICGIGTAATGNPKALIGGPPAHRKGDLITTPGGYGTSILGSPTVMG